MTWAVFVKELIDGLRPGRFTAEGTLDELLRLTGCETLEDAFVAATGAAGGAR